MFGNSLLALSPIGFLQARAYQDLQACKLQAGGAAAGGSKPALASPGVINVDGEHSLVVIKASSTTAVASIGQTHVSANLALGSFEIQDSLASMDAPSLRYLARSAANSTQDGPEQEEFYDAQASLGRGSMSSHATAGSDHFEDAEDGTERDREIAGSASNLPGAPRHHAWVLEFKSWKPDSPEYAGLDAELQTRLTTLLFFCNRPTVAALMCFGDDLTAALKAGQPAQPAPARPRQLESQESISDLSSLENAGARSVLRWPISSRLHALPHVTEGIGIMSANTLREELLAILCWHVKSRIAVIIE